MSTKSQWRQSIKVCLPIHDKELLAEVPDKEVLKDFPGGTVDKNLLARLSSSSYKIMWNGNYCLDHLWKKQSTTGDLHRVGSMVDIQRYLLN